jgi:hypothetical protein
LADLLAVPHSGAESLGVIEVIDIRVKKVEHGEEVSLVTQHRCSGEEKD